MSIDLNEALRVSLDQQIFVLREETLRLLHQRNTLAPVAHVPSEILAEIFVRSRDLALENEGNYNAGLALLQVWKSLTHTCQHWRNVAIHCPRLWSVLHLNKHTFTWLRIALDRANSSPLSVTINGLMGHLQQDAVEYITSRMPTVRELSLSYPYDNRERLPALLSSCKAPSLESLVVTGCGGKFGNSWPLPWETLFSGCTPKLQRLSIQEMEFTWKMPLLHCRTLTSLSLTGASKDHYHTALTAAEFVNTFQSLPLLEHLQLAYCFSLKSGSSPGAKASLPRLQTLDLTADSQALGRVMQCLKLPPSVRIWLSTIPVEPFGVLAEAIVEHCRIRQDDRREPMAGIHLVEDSRDRGVITWKVRAWESYNVSEPARDFTDGLWLEIELSERHTSIHQVHILATLVQAMSASFSQASELWLVGGDDLSTSSWSTIFLPFTSVQSLRLARLSEGLISAIADDSLSNGRLPFPSLKDVMIFDSHFGTSSGILAWLDARAQLGFQVETLSLVRCSHDWMALEEEEFCSGVYASVGHVVWWDLCLVPCSVDD